MIYLLIPISMLLFYTMYSLSEKFLGCEPLWVKVYVLVSFIIIMATPVLVIQKVWHLLEFSVITMSYITIFCEIVLLLSIINVMPKEKTKC